MCVWLSVTLGGFTQGFSTSCLCRDKPRQSVKGCVWVVVKSPTSQWFEEMPTGMRDRTLAIIIQHGYCYPPGSGGKSTARQGSSLILSVCITGVDALPYCGGWWSMSVPGAYMLCALYGSMHAYFLFQQLLSTVLVGPLVVQINCWIGLQALAFVTILREFDTFRIKHVPCKMTSHTAGWKKYLDLVGSSM